MTVVSSPHSASKSTIWRYSASNMANHGHMSTHKSPRSSQSQVFSPSANVQHSGPTGQRQMSQYSIASNQMEGQQGIGMGWQDEDDSNILLKRSFSTPAVKSLAASSSSDPSLQSGSAGEKKRNKLGYNRTTIACTHCRRRKIRCIVSPEVEGRCINCVRLKKECSFQPVDSQASTPDKRRESTQAPVSATIPVLPSNSPSLTIGEVNPQDTPPYEHYSAAEMPLHHGSMSAAGMSVENTAMFAPETGAAIGMSQMPGNWQPTTNSTATNAPGANMMWPPAQIPMNEGMGNYAPAPVGMPAWSSVASSSVSGDEWSWGSSIPSTTRSMSLSGDYLHSQQTPEVMSAMHMSQGLNPGSDAYSGMYAVQGQGQRIQMGGGGAAPMATGVMDPEAWPAEEFRKPGVDFGNWQFPNSQGDGSHM